MKNLIKVRNSLVHKRDVNAVQARREFVTSLDAVLREVYVLYSDYVLKNPFYEMDMPINCERFTQKLEKLAEDYHRRA